MANYDWREYRARPWTGRFPEGVRGLAVWRQYAPSEALAVRLMETRRATAERLPRPCVFVSHRQADVAPALRIAYLACQEGFDYWLDVLDPTLSAMTASAMPGSGKQATAVATAAIIEMALLNSTHVMAVMTPNTNGSQWVPYEYGRVKDPLPITLQAACWRHNTLPASALPEYLCLGTITSSDADVQHWLRTESQRYAPSGTRAPCNWQGPVPPAL